MWILSADFPSPGFVLFVLFVPIIGVGSSSHLPLVAAAYASFSQRINLVNCLRHGRYHIKDDDEDDDEDDEDDADDDDEDEQVERYISVVHPHHWLRQLSSAIYIVPVVLLTIVWNICRSSSSHHQSTFLHLAV